MSPIEDGHISSPFSQEKVSQSSLSAGHRLLSAMIAARSFPSSTPNPAWGGKAPSQNRLTSPTSGKYRGVPSGRRTDGSQTPPLVPSTGCSSSSHFHSQGEGRGNAGTTEGLRRSDSGGRGSRRQSQSFLDIGSREKSAEVVRQDHAAGLVVGQALAEGRGQDEPGLRGLAQRGLGIGGVNRPRGQGPHKVVFHIARQTAGGPYSFQDGLEAGQSPFSLQPGKLVVDYYPEGFSGEVALP